MKQALKLLSVLILSVTMFVGCATSPSANNSAALNAAITLAASTGTELALTPPNGKPANAIYFVGAEQALNTVSSGTNAVTVTTVEAALQAAGVTNAIIASSIEEAVSLGDALIVSNAGTNESEQVIEAQVVAGDIATGIQQGLSLAGVQTLKKK